MSIFRKTWVLLLALLMFSGFCAAEGAFSWERVTVKGRGYVPVDNLRSFYGFTAPIKQEGGWNVIANQKTTIKIRPHSQELKMNKLLFILCHPIIQDASGRMLISQTDVIKIIDPILRPDYIRSASAFKTIILDPGHGGKDAGATNSSMREADLNLKLAKILQPKLEQQGFTVVLTRDRDIYLTLQQRVEIANRYKNAIFISLHFNDGGKGANGVETYTLTPAGVASTFKSSRSSDSNSLRGNAQDSANIALATAIQGTAVYGTSIYGPDKKRPGLGAEDRGIKRARFSVLCGIQHPAVLFEGGFMSNSGESQLLLKPGYLERMADCISDGVRKYKIFAAKAQR